MGDPRKQHKKFVRPKKIWSKTRIETEMAITKAYGLKNTKEIWRTETAIAKIRDQAKKLIVKPQEQKAFFNRLKNMGLVKGDANIDDVLALTKEKLLDRRLQTIVYKIGLAKKIKEARQLITHRKIKINDKIMDVPGYIVRIDEERKITLVHKEPKSREQKMPEIKEEMPEAK